RFYAQLVRYRDTVHRPAGIEGPVLRPVAPAGIDAVVNRPDVVRRLAFAAEVERMQDTPDAAVVLLAGVAVHEQEQPALAGAEATPQVFGQVCATYLRHEVERHLAFGGFLGVHAARPFDAAGQHRQTAKPRS